MQPPHSSTSQDALIVFALGLAGVTVFHIVAPVAWILGNRYVERCAQAGVAPESLATLGRILGIIGTALLVFGFLMMVGIVVFGIGVFGLFLGTAGRG